MKYDPLSRYHWLPANPISDDRLDACVIIGAAWVVFGVHTCTTSMSSAAMSASPSSSARSAPRCSAAMLLRVLAADQSRLAVRVTRSGVSEDLTQVAVQLRAQADAYAQKAADDVGGISAIVSPSWEPFSYTDNLLAGRDV